MENPVFLGQRAQKPWIFHRGEKSEEAFFYNGFSIRKNPEKLESQGTFNFSEEK